jgi:predicted deacetylase
MPQDNQKIEDAINRMHHGASNLINHARHPRSKSIEWEGLVWQKELLEYARAYTKSVDKLTRIRKMVKVKRHKGLRGPKAPA